jgi:hypothetical protein
MRAVTLRFHRAPGCRRAEPTARTRAQIRTSDSAAVKQLHATPGILNLARTLAFHSQLLRDAPLPPAAAAAQRERVADLTEMLRTIMCL